MRVLVHRNIDRHKYNNGQVVQTLVHAIFVDRNTYIIDVQVILYIFCFHVFIRLLIYILFATKVIK
jgi:hypothetical protein